MTAPTRAACTLLYLICNGEYPSMRRMRAVGTQCKNLALIVCIYAQCVRHVYVWFVPVHPNASEHLLEPQCPLTTCIILSLNPPHMSFPTPCPGVLMARNFAHFR